MAAIRGRKNWASDPANKERVRANAQKGVEAQRAMSEFDKAMHRLRAKRYAGRKKKPKIWAHEKDSE